MLGNLRRNGDKFSNPLIEYWHLKLDHEHSSIHIANREEKLWYIQLVISNGQSIDSPDNASVSPRFAPASISRN